MNLRRTSLAAMGALALASGIVTALAPASPAFAICDGPKYNYIIDEKVRTYLPTNVMTPWATGPFHLTLSQTTTATATASVTASVSAEAGVVFAKASTSLGVSVGGSWSHSAQWSGDTNVPKGKQGRLRLYHEARGFRVTKQELRTPCKYVTVYRSGVKAPVKTGDDDVRLDTRAIPKSTGDSGGDGTAEHGAPQPEESEVVTTTSSTGELTDAAPPNGLPDDPITDSDSGE
jgi:hypothetical protein